MDFDPYFGGPRPSGAGEELSGADLPAELVDALAVYKAATTHAEETRAMLVIADLVEQQVMLATLSCDCCCSRLTLN